MAGEILSRPQAGVAERQSVGKTLVDRKLYAWAEKEYDLAIGQADPLNPREIVVIEEYSNLLADGEKYDQAAAVWEAIAMRIEKEPLFRDQIQMTYPQIGNGRAADSFVEKYYFLKAKGAIRSGRKGPAMEYLSSAVAAFEMDSDAWIEMYRLSPTEETRRRVAVGSKPLADSLRAIVEENDTKQWDGNIDRYSMHRQNVARALNELAWLAANTGGDLDEALKYATRAVEIWPTQSAYIDTLARVHFGRKEYSKAIELQTRAIALEPQDRQMQRVLEQYKEALRQESR